MKTMLLCLLIAFSFGVQAQNRTGCCSLQNKVVGDNKSRMIELANEALPGSSFINFTQVQLTLEWLHNKHQFDQDGAAPGNCGVTKVTKGEAQVQLKKILSPEFRMSLFGYILNMDIINGQKSAGANKEQFNEVKVLREILNDPDYE